MALTGLEQVLFGVICLGGGAVVGRVIPPTMTRRECNKTHEDLNKLLDAKFEGVENRLERIEKKIDSKNNNGSWG